MNNKQQPRYSLKKAWPILILAFSSFKVLSNNELSEELSSLLHQAAELRLHATQLDFADHLANQDKSELASQQSKLIAIQKTLNQESTKHLSFCDQVATQDIRFVIELAQERINLLEKDPHNKTKYNGSFQTIKQGEQWYKHWLKSWLQADVSIEELERIALSELADVTEKRQALSKRNLPHDKGTIDGKAHSDIVSTFKQKETLVYQHMARVFGTDFQAPPFKIAKSDLPKDFPAPGIYNGYTQTFIYHLHTDELPRKHMDWLFIHEGVPGHHYQSQFARNSATCPSSQSLPGAAIFAEGWGAYVETLGQQLGLFKDSSSISYALDWQAMRAVRVLIDVGIHHKGWTDEQARATWMSHIPEQADIMEREIKRIRRWPAQVITYVYGKAKIKQAIEQRMADYSDWSLADVHRNILGLSNFSVKALLVKKGT